MRTHICVWAQLDQVAFVDDFVDSAFGLTVLNTKILSSQENLPIAQPVDVMT
jgi:hypothetical protein